MSVRTSYTCDQCGYEFKAVNSVGYRPDVETAVFYYPVQHLRVTDTRGDTYDFCSPDCLELKELK